LAKNLKKQFLTLVTAEAIFLQKEIKRLINKKLGDQYG